MSSLAAISAMAVDRVPQGFRHRFFDSGARPTTPIQRFGRASLPGVGAKFKGGDGGSRSAETVRNLDFFSVAIAAPAQPFENLRDALLEAAVGG